MSLPTGWPPRVASGTRSIRFFVSGTATANYSDNAYLFQAGTGADTFTTLPIVKPGNTTTPTVVPTTPSGSGQTDPGAPTPMTWSFGIRIQNLDGTNAIRYSFDGINDHGQIKAGADVQFNRRHEAGISIKAVAGSPSFIVEAW